MQHLDPSAAYAYLAEHPEAVLVDCRTEIEHMYVGHPVGAEHVAWQEAPDWEVNRHFVEQVVRLVKKDLARPVLRLGPPSAPGHSVHVVVFCSACGCRSRFGASDNEAEVIAIWNRRA